MVKTAPCIFARAGERFRRAPAVLGSPALVAKGKAVPKTAQQIRTVEMHTGGEPVRIVASGYPPIPGDTILAKRRHAREELDHLRRLLMFEPRGHADMYGVIPVQPDLPGADLAVLFMHNEGYSTMCGHAVIALGRYALDRGLVPIQAPETEVRIQCPCGLVTARAVPPPPRPGRSQVRRGTES